MIEVPRRLAPTSETVRRLFLLSGNQCAFPECTHPIILQDGSYVGEQCHIRAAEEGGERFDKAQTNEDRRAFENLMLLCHDHHVVTNDVDAYPVSTMLEMKARHEARFERGLAAMMDSAGVQVVDSVVVLGGGGGSAPGAGGGGGGAMGPGARAGDGGRGGEVRRGLFPVTPDLVELRFHVGETANGGEPGRSGEDGEDTVVEAVFRDGSTKELLRAKGGRGGASGNGRAAVRWAVLANSAEVREGLLFVMAGGWQSYTVNQLPWPASFAVAFVAEPDDAREGIVTASVLDPDGAVVGTISQAFDFARGPVPSAFQFFVPFSRLGTWSVTLVSDQRELQRVSINVVRGTEA